MKPCHRGHEIYNFGWPFLSYHFYIIHALSNRCPKIEISCFFTLPSYPTDATIFLPSSYQHSTDKYTASLCNVDSRHPCVLTLIQVCSDERPSLHLSKRRHNENTLMIFKIFILIRMTGPVSMSFGLSWHKHTTIHRWVNGIKISFYEFLKKRNIQCTGIIIVCPSSCSPRNFFSCWSIVTLPPIHP